MLEVFTIGGGEYLVDVFNAVAAWSGGGGFRSLIQVVMVMGLIYSLLVMAFHLDWRAGFNWFLQSTAIYMMLLVPTVTIKVTDRLEPGLAPATIANVPLGLGMMASLTSQMGDWMTTTAETVFVMPDALKLSTNGMVYGARLLEKAQHYDFTDAEFRANLDEHYKQCVFYDVLLGFKSMDQLQRSKDLWSDIGPGSGARAQRWLTRDAGGGSTTSSVVTCHAAYTALNGQVNAVVESAASDFALQAYNKLPRAAALAKLKADLPIAANSLHGATAADAIGYLRQVSMIEAFRRARDSFSDDQLDAFATERAEAQARNTYTSIAQQAMTWVPLLNVVLTVVFYAMFPVVFPLFLFPRTGIQTLKGYTTGFFYLASWGPLTVVLHMFVMQRAINAMSAVAPGGTTLLVSDGVQAVNNDIATIAGFMMMSVPFIAAGMARGAMAIAGQATSMLAPAQNAAEAAANERTTGNYSYGNVSFANATSNMTQANKWDTTPAYATGFPTSSFTGADGVTRRTFADGSSTWDSRGAMSFLPDRIDSRTGLSWSLSRALTNEQANMRRISDASVSSTGTSRSRSHTTSSGTSSTWGNEASQGRQSGTSYDRSAGSDMATGDRVEAGTKAGQGTRRGALDQTRSAESDSSTFSKGLNESLAINGQGKFGFGTGGGGPGLGGSVGIDGTARGSLEQTWASRSETDHSQSLSTDRFTSEEQYGSDARFASRQQNYSAKRGVNDGTYERAGGFARDDHSRSDMHSTSLSFNTAEEKRHALEASQERARRLSETLSKVESGELQISGDISTPVASMYEEYRLTHPDEFLPSVAATQVSPEQYALRHHKLMELAEQYLRPSIDAHVAGPAFDHDNTLDIAPNVSDPQTPSLFLPRKPSAPLGAEGTSYDGRPEAAAHGMMIKPGAQIGSLDPRMAPVIGAVAGEAERLGIDPRTITSGDDSVHLPGSRHHDGQGLDFRGNDITPSQGKQLASAVSRRLGEGYYVAFEERPGEPDNHHLHVQTRGKR